jgi:hypothetical protein
MKNLFYILAVGILLVTFNACTGDDNNVGDSGPSIDFTTNPGAGFLTGDATLTGGVPINIKITGTKGDSPLKVLHINSKNGSGSEQHVDFTTMKVNGTAASSNPILILNASDKSGFTYTIEFPSESNSDTILYTVELEDEAGKTDDISFTITTNDIRITTLTNKKLTNSASPAGQGGIDLHTGNETGSTDPTAELAAGGNLLPSLDWSQQFSPASSETTIRKPGVGFSFDALTTKPNIQSEYNLGTDVNSPVTGKKDDVYLIKSGNFYWAVKITNIFLTPPFGQPNGDNLDHFVLTIKQ